MKLQRVFRFCGMERRQSDDDVEREILDNIKN